MVKNGEYRMNEDALRRDLWLLVGFLLTGAHGLYGEPANYGPFRLLDSVGRLVEIMEQQGLGSSRLASLREQIEAGKNTAMGTEEEHEAFLESLVNHLVDQIGPGAD